MSYYSFLTLQSFCSGTNTKIRVKQAQESLAAAMNLSDNTGIVTSWADCYKNSTPNLNIKVKLQLQSQSLKSNIKLQSQTSNFDKISFHNVWRSIKTSLSTKGMVYKAFILKIKKRPRTDEWTDGRTNEWTDDRTSGRTDGRTEWHGHYLSCSSQLKRTWTNERTVTLSLLELLLQDW